MSQRLSEKEVHDYLEQISERGCEEVNQLLAQSLQGIEIPEISHLDKEQQRQVILELEKVMAVYTSCESDPSGS